jgi:hypothetical protein
MILALRRARFCILTVAAIYVVSAISGILMVHAGNRLAISYRDRIVGRALAGDPAARALSGGHRARAAIIDFGRNLLLGALPQTISGLAIVPPYFIGAFRGWVGGIVSIDGNHRSRLASAPQRNYYLGVLILQMLPFSLTGGAGVHLGLSCYRKWRDSGLPRRWNLLMPRAALVDVAWIYALSVPLFLLASSVEFLKF